MGLPYFRKPFQPVKRKREHNINDDVVHPTIRISGDNIESKVLSLADALLLAKELGLDLVEISPNTDPPVCKICDYNKFLFDRKKKKKSNEKNNQVSELKEMQLTPNIGQHDVEFKVKQAIEWLSEGHKVKCIVLFKGRNITFKDRGELLLLKISQMMDSVGKVEQLPKLEGNRMSMIVIQKIKKKK